MQWGKLSKAGRPRQHVLPVVGGLLRGADAVKLKAPAAEVVGAATCELTGGGSRLALVVAGVVGAALVRERLVLADGQVLSTQVPVHIHGTHASLSQGRGDRLAVAVAVGAHVVRALVAKRHVAASLLDRIRDALVVVEASALRGLLAGAGVDIRLKPLVPERGVSHPDREAAASEGADEGHRKGRRATGFLRTGLLGLGGGRRLNIERLRELFLLDDRHGGRGIG